MLEKKRKKKSQKMDEKYKSYWHIISPAPLHQFCTLSYVMLSDTYIINKVFFLPLLEIFPT